ncbi:hypothetical protein AVEN_222351-1 [Araneus ventricosus]|uniref:Uncharacterized protein n=1 Tax=Araneus ventricosus TaxID=182803 RepID=A0A4Y2LE34_ARAVE|nr:hypothetical protein AVEN_222351-1 [Araneus ventricosus]
MQLIVSVVSSDHIQLQGWARWKTQLDRRPLVSFPRSQDEGADCFFILHRILMVNPDPSWVQFQSLVGLITLVMLAYFFFDLTSMASSFHIPLTPQNLGKEPF